MDTCFLFSFLNCILQRMKSFAFIDNPLVVYVDNDEDYDYVRSIRQHIDQNRTCIVELERSRMWTFSTFNKQRVQNITSTEGYPRIYPSTVVADYSLMRNAKYEVSASEYWQNNEIRRIYSNKCQLGCMTCRHCTVSVNEAGLMQTALTVGPWWTPISKHLWLLSGCFVNAWKMR